MPPDLLPSSPPSLATPPRTGPEPIEPEPTSQRLDDVKVIITPATTQHHDAASSRASSHSSPRRPSKRKNPHPQSSPPWKSALKARRRIATVNKEHFRPLSASDQLRSDSVQIPSLNWPRPLVITSSSEEYEDADEEEEEEEEDYDKGLSEDEGDSAAIPSVSRPLSARRRSRRSFESERSVRQLKSLDIEYDISTHEESGPRTSKHSSVHPRTNRPQGSVQLSWGNGDASTPVTQSAQHYNRQHNVQSRTLGDKHGEVKRVKFGSVEFLDDQRRLHVKNLAKPQGNVGDIPETSNGGQTSKKRPERSPYPKPAALRTLGRSSDGLRRSVSSAQTPLQKNEKSNRDFPVQAKSTGRMMREGPPQLYGEPTATARTKLVQATTEDSESDEDAEKTEKTEKPQKPTYAIEYVDSKQDKVEQHNAFGESIRVEPLQREQDPPIVQPDGTPPSVFSLSTISSDKQSGIITATPLYDALFPSAVASRDVGSALPTPTPSPNQPEHEFWEYTVYRNNWRRFDQYRASSEDTVAGRRVSCGSYLNLQEANEAALAEALVLRQGPDFHGRQGPRGLRMTPGLEFHMDSHDHGMMNIVLMHASISQVHIHVERCLRISKIDPQIALQQGQRGSSPDQTAAWKPGTAYLVWQRADVDTAEDKEIHSPSPSPTSSDGLSSLFSSSSTASTEEKGTGRNTAKVSPLLVSGPHTTMSSANEAAFRHLNMHIYQQHPEQQSVQTGVSAKRSDMVGEVQRAELVQRLRAHWEESERRVEPFKAEIETWVSTGPATTESDAPNPGRGSPKVTDDGEKCGSVRVWVEERKVLGPRN